MFPLGGLPAVLGWLILLLVHSSIVIRNYSAVILGKLVCEGRFFVLKLDWYGVYVLQTMLLLIAGRGTYPCAQLIRSKF